MGGDVSSDSTSSWVRRVTGNFACSDQTISCGGGCVGRARDGSCFGGRVGVSFFSAMGAGFSTIFSSWRGGGAGGAAALTGGIESKSPFGPLDDFGAGGGARCSDQTNSFGPGWASW